ncbi:MAG: hypothetical protein IJH38_03735, partial [Clostridia bacterium]|nr:hypothetical protein [Clostridia bacterium]
MQSMTGYGRAFVEIDGRQMTVEVKSVNHRFLDISFRMPRNLMFLEDTARREIAATISRGHVDVFLTYRNMRTDARDVQVDEALFGAYARALEGLHGLSGHALKDDRSLMAIARLPDVLVVSEAQEDQDAVKVLLRSTLGEAMKQLCAMRGREGSAICRDLSDRVDAIERMTAAIEERYPQTVAAYTQRLR